jgi:hypothetical protein
VKCHTRAARLMINMLPVKLDRRRTGERIE